MDLLILAGGAGSRFGGPKQFEPIDDNQNFIMDYSIYDAIEAGFDRVVLITRKKYADLIDKTLKKRLEGKVGFKVIFQESDWIENDFGIKREKPLGTGHAILIAKDIIKDNFCMINADDFYGKTSFKIAYNFLKSIQPSSTDFALVGYKLKNTMSEKGAVKRGICKEENGFVTEIIESKAEFVNNKIVVHELESNKEYNVSPVAPVSMNMLCLTPKLFDFLQIEFDKFVNNKNNLKDKEFLIPTILDNMSKQNLASIKLLKSPEKWIGMTYKEDKVDVVNGIKKLVNKNQYPQNLWNTKSKIIEENKLELI